MPVADLGGVLDKQVGEAVGKTPAGMTCTCRAGNYVASLKCRGVQMASWTPLSSAEMAGRIQEHPHDATTLTMP